MQVVHLIYDYLAQDIMVKNQSDNGREKLLLPLHGLLFLISSKGSSERIVNTTAFVISAVDHWLE